MTTFITFAGLVFPLLYISLCIYIFRGLRSVYTRSADRPFITIMVPARNEAQNISACLDSLSRLTYPSTKLEILVLNDRSTDSTQDIISRFCSMHPEIKTVNITDDRDGLSGKMNVLAQGIDIARGEIILVTDADCQVTTGWADEMVAHFTSDTGMVGGVTILKHYDRKNTIFAQVQALDWLFLQGIASGMTGSGRPVSILGNNFAFRRQAYDQTGGFRKIGFSLTEDMALMQAISRLGTWKIKYPLQEETMIFSRPANSWRELYYQRLRWVSGGITGPFTGWILMSTAFLTHLYIIFGLAAGNVSALLALIPVLLADLICIVRPLLNRLGWQKLYYYFIVFEVYYILYTIFMAFLIFIPQKVAWKDRSY